MSGSQSVWELSTISGNHTTALLGGGSMTSTAQYNAQGLLTNLGTTKEDVIIRNFGYDFNGLTGNLTSRTGMVNLKESFEYDELDRLDIVMHGEPGNVVMSVGYAANGNISSKTGLGTYSYMPGKPHAIKTIDNTDGLINSRGQSIDYTAFNKALCLKDTVGSDALELNITYGPDLQRWKTELKKNSIVTKTVIFAGDYERVSQGRIIRDLYYISGGDGLCAILVKQTGQADNYYFVHPDHLGSLAIITDISGNVVQKCSYDAWGNRTLIQGSLMFDRGYTGHEHLAEFGLINMNGRMYDPLIGRFLSPDPYVQAPDFSQNFNRYSYCLNNPLIYTDPSGEIIFSFLAAIIPGAQFLLPVAMATDFGWMQGGMRATMQGQSFWSGAWKGAIVGAVGGGLGMIGGAGMSFSQNLLLGTGQGALVGGLDAALWGNDIGKGILWGAAAGAVFTTLTSENFSNMLKGEGFYTNENVFNNMIERGMDKQAVLGYFGFEGTYTGTTKGPSYVDGGGEGASFFGSTNPQTGNIRYGDLAFDSYDKLKMTYNKEMYHSLRVKNGIPLETQGTEFGKHLKYYPEERLGFIHAYKNQGLYPSAGKGLMGNISFYQMQSFNLNPSQYYSAKWWHFMYKIPRRW